MIAVVRKSAQLCIIYGEHKFHWFPRASCAERQRRALWGEKFALHWAPAPPATGFLPAKAAAAADDGDVKASRCCWKMSSLTNSSLARSLSFASSCSHLYAADKKHGWRKLFLHLINSHYWNNSARACRTLAVHNSRVPRKKFTKQ